MEIKPYIANISKKVTDYLRKRDETSLFEIKELLEEYFESDKFCYFLYNKSSLTLQNIFDKKRLDIGLTKGLIKESIYQSSALCIDRVHSHKLYCSEVDNIYNVKIKSMMIVPIQVNDATSAVLVLYRDVKRRTLFTQDDVKNLALFLPSLQKLTMVMESNGKNHSRHLPVPDKEKQQVKPKEHSGATKQQNLELELEVKALKALLHNVQKENKTLSEKLISVEKEKINDVIELQKRVNEWENQYRTLKNIHTSYVEETDEVLMHNKQEIVKLRELKDTLKKENISLKENTPKVVIEEEEYKSLAIKYDAFVEKYFEKEEENKTIIEKYKKAYDTLTIQYKEKINAYDKQIEELNNKIVFLTQEHSREEVNESADSNITEITLLENKLEYFENKIKELEDEKTNIEKKYNENISNIAPSTKVNNNINNISSILLSLNTKFNKNKYAYMFFELILYALPYDKSLTYVNEKFENSKMIFNLLEQYTLPISVNANKESYALSSLIEKIKLYEKKLFAKAIHITIEKEKLLPDTLKIDMSKLQSVIYYLLMDFSTFIDINEKLIIDISSDKSFIFVDITGKIMDTKSSFIGFYNKTPVKDISERPELQCARILLNSLDMDIEPHYQGKDYRLSFSVPYEKIA